MPARLGEIRKSEAQKCTKAEAEVITIILRKWPQKVDKKKAFNNHL
jgi:hypothetical protein